MIRMDLPQFHKLSISEITLEILGALVSVRWGQLAGKMWQIRVEGIVLYFRNI